MPRLLRNAWLLVDTSAWLVNIPPHIVLSAASRVLMRRAACGCEPDTSRAQLLALQLQPLRTRRLQPAMGERDGVPQLLGSLLLWLRSVGTQECLEVGG